MLCSLKRTCSWFRYQTSRLMDACWSPVRPSVFFTVKTDGVLDVWDILFKQDDPTLSIKVSEVPVKPTEPSAFSVFKRGVFLLFRCARRPCTACACRTTDVWWRVALSRVWPHC